MSKPEIVWTSSNGLVTAEDLSEKKPFLLRWHTDINHIPGRVAASCVIAEVKDFEAEVKGWGGRKGPTIADKNIIRDFCIFKRYHTAEWWRYKNDQEPYQVWIYRDSDIKE